MNRALTAFLAATLAALLPAGARAGTPAAGVAQEIRQGLYADVNLGGFFTAGGKNLAGKTSVSNAQAYLQLGLGYDVLSFSEGKYNLGAGIHFGLGSSAASCFGERVGAKCNYGANDPDAPEDFSLTMIGAEVVFRWRVLERVFVRPRLDGGLAMLAPEPMRGASRAGYFGIGVGVEYATNMDHFTIGAEIGSRFIFAPTVIPAIAFYPRVKYTF